MAVGNLDTIRSAVMFFLSAVYATSGLYDVCLFLCTRPRLLRATEVRPLTDEEQLDMGRLPPMFAEQQNVAVEVGLEPQET
jgi:hypothetical protein